jgi:hypothetical protein
VAFFCLRFLFFALTFDASNQSDTELTVELIKTLRRKLTV